MGGKELIGYTITNKTTLFLNHLRNYIFTITDQKTISPITIKYKPISITVNSLEV